MADTAAHQAGKRAGLRAAAAMIDQAAKDVQASNPDTHRAVTAFAAALAAALRVSANLPTPP